MTFQPKKQAIAILYSICWFFVNLLTLLTYPVMHSDEAWLAGLTRTMMDKGTLMTTESFFNTAPRAPHTLKVLYHLLEMPFILLFGDSLFSARLLSLVFGTLSVLLVLALLKQWGYKAMDLLIPVLLITTCSQVIYASHFGRQEILLVAVLLLSLYYYGKDSTTYSLAIGGIIGLSILIHPNAFIIAVMIGSLYLFDVIFKRISLKTLLIFISPMAISAAANVTIILVSTENFLSNYWQYASELQVGAAPASRVENFIDYYIKLYNRISGTYFLTDIRWFFLLCVLAIFLIALAYTLNYKRSELGQAKHLHQSLLMILGFNIALFTIGRYNPTAIIFMMLPGLFFIIETIKLLLPSRFQAYTLLFVLFFSMNSTYTDYRSTYDHDYVAYLDFLSLNIGPEDILLGNLSGGFAMANNQFYDVRNLAYLDTDVKDYFIENNINTVIWYEEYDYIHRNPAWQILYKEDILYYDDIKKILEDQGTLRAETTSTHYGNRIIRYQDGYPWHIWVYDLDL